MTKRHFPLIAIVCIVLILVSGSGVRAQQDLPPEVLAYADMVLYNGKVLMADDKFTIVEAVAIREGKIMAVGTTNRILRMAGPKTQRFDLEGRTVTPGFIDTHFHLNTYAFVDQPPLFPVIGLKDLGANKTKEGLLQAIRKIAPKLVKETPPGQWIVITDALDGKHGLVEVLMAQLRTKDLDEIFPNHPAAAGGGRQDAPNLFNVNSLGLEIFKSHASPNTLKGMVRDPKTQEPTGALQGLAASFLDFAILPFPDVQEAAELIRKAMLKYNAQGLTNICTKTPPYLISALRELWVQGKMTIRWRANIETFLTPDPEQMYKLVGNLSDLGDPMFKIRGAYVPGTDGHFPWVWTAARQLLPGAQGVSLYGESSRTKRWERPDGYAWHYYYLGVKYGWNMTGAHNKGDRGADALLAALEAGKSDQVVPNSRQTFGVDHAVLLSEITPEGRQWDRMKKLNMIPSLGMPFIFDPPNAGRAADQGKGIAYASMSALEQVIYAFGAERVHKMLPAKSLIRAGLKPVAESDRGIFPQCCPMWNLEKLVTRKDDRLPGIWGPHEAVTREEALLMYTNWAAYYTGDEAILGTLESGKIADLVIIDGDYLKVPDDQISELRILMTMVNGKIVYSNPDFKAVEDQTTDM